METATEIKILNELSALRTDMKQVKTELQVEMKKGNEGLKAGLQAEMREGFAQVDQRFAQVDQRLAQVDQRFDQVDQRLDQVDQRLAQVDQRFDQVDQRLDQVDQRFAQVDQKLSHISIKIENEVERGIRLLSEGHTEIINQLKDINKRTTALEEDVALLKVVRRLKI